MSTTVRISKETHQTLRQLSEQCGEPMHQVLTKALEAYRRRLFMESFSASYAKLRADPKQWAEVLHEREEWDGVLLDNQEGP